jgi:translation initiation factor IF-2
MMNQVHDSQDFNVIVKADVQGSLTSVIDSLKLIDTKGEIKLNIIGSGVGNVTENDIRMAMGNNTVIYGFNIDISTAIRQLAVRDKVQVRIYKVIYQLLDDAKESMQSMLAPEVVETPVGSMVIKGVFRTLKDEIIAGGEVTEGKIVADTLARVMRKKEQIAEVKVASVQRQQSEAKEVFAGEMCGVSLKISKKMTIEEGDVLNLFNRELVKRTLK